MRFIAQRSHEFGADWLVHRPLAGRRRVCPCVGGISRWGWNLPVGNGNRTAHCTSSRPKWASEWASMQGTARIRCADGTGLAWLQSVFPFQYCCTPTECCCGGEGAASHASRPKKGKRRGELSRWFICSWLQISHPLAGPVVVYSGVAIVLVVKN